ncbi:hypothetical protein GQ53DRAFT_632432 [Thozetella sp. PMI_491]|nr:hypothetical protein GQ53DRAFT_632432 [Thozetella sp. PMI_491]
MVAELIHIPLSPLDYVPGINYSAVVLYLGMLPGTSPAEAFSHLQEGLRRVILQVPWLNGKLHWRSPEAPGWRPGQLEIRYRPIDADGPVPPYQLRFNELNSKLSYEEIKASGFPLDAFDDEELLWKPFLPDMTEGTEVLVAQANFLPGACLLACSIVHKVADAAGNANMVRLWANHCRSIGTQVPAPELPDGSWDRGMPEAIWAKEAVTRPVAELELTTWHMVGLEPPGPDDTPSAPVPAAPSLRVRGMKSKMFYMSPAAFNTLRRECESELGATDLSGNDLLIAFMWRSIIKARTACESDFDLDDQVEMVVTTDGRHNFSQSMSLPQEYLGNVVLHHWPTLPLRTLIAPQTTIPSVAQEIRNSAKNISHQTIMDAYALLRDCPDYNRVLRMSPRRLLVSSMLMLPDEISFGGSGIFTNGGRLESYRHLTTTRDKLCLPVCFIMPRKKSGGIEFTATLFKEELDWLLNDEEFGRYAYLLA